MKRIFNVLFLCLSFNAFAQQGIVKESLTIKSSLLGKDVKYNIYLPAWLWR